MTRPGKLSRKGLEIPARAPPRKTEPKRIGNSGACGSVRTDGCYVAGFRVQGAVTYFADDEGRNEAKAVVESLLRGMPEQSMRVQFRYEVVESLNGLLDRYRDASRSETPEAKVLDGRRLATWEEKERPGAYLSRISGVYLIWDLELGTNDCRGWIRTRSLSA
jgi:hypothetical protein